MSANATAPEITKDPNGVPHRTAGTCSSTTRRVPVNTLRPELGTTAEFGHPACGEPATVNRFVKVSQATYYRPVYACPTHARS